LPTAVAGPANVRVKESIEATVAFNVQTHKVHKLSCPAAQRCTRNCVNLGRGEAYKRGGVPCKVCGG